MSWMAEDLGWTWGSLRAGPPPWGVLIANMERVIQRTRRFGGDLGVGEESK
jgi:hypothetical protein